MNIEKLNDFLAANACFDKSKITGTLEVPLSNHSSLLVMVSTPEDQLTLAFDYLQQIIQENADEPLIA